jgi:uncharacterized protein (DUF2141 family)
MENTQAPDQSWQSTNYPKQPSQTKDKAEAFAKNPWKENHGTLLLAFAGLICLIGAGIIACRQTRFIPPSFPTQLNRALIDGERQSIVLGDAPAELGPRLVNLRIFGAGSDDGTMKFAVYVQPDGFNDPRKALDIGTWRIDEGNCSGRLEIAPEIRRIAIAAYHDVNDNGELDKNALGIPSERYGFTGGARGLTGPPSFDEAVIEITDKPIEISIR